MDWFDALPKVELHVHLEGAIPLPFLWLLIQRHEVDVEIADLAALEQRFIFRDFQHFLHTWVWKNQFIRNLDDLSNMTEAVAHTFVAQHIRYVEAHCSPIDFRQHGITIPDAIRAYRRGLARVPRVEVALIVDVVRNYGAEEAERTLDAILSVRDQGVIGIGLGGDELHYPPQLFASVFARARAAGLHVTAHAGEGAGPPSIRHALDDLQVERLGHGIKVLEDEALLQELVERKIPLEVCPTSNLRTGLVTSFAAHPITQLRQRGLVITVNSDDPAMFNCTLAGEFRRLVAEHAWTDDDVRDSILTAIEVSWLPPERKTALRLQFQQDPAWQNDQSTFI
jgi:adenosine deaminase